MSQSTEKMVLSSRARKLMSQFEMALEGAEREVAKRHATASSVLSSVCHLLNQRARYMGGVGEHFNVTEYDAIQVIDQLDERLLRAVHTLLHEYSRKRKKKPKVAAIELLQKKLSSGSRDIPQYPVGYMIFYQLTSAFKSFEPLVRDRGCGFTTPELEIALVTNLLGQVERYVQSRDKPVLRHFSDVAREYSVVMRLKCDCGGETYEVRLQALCQTPGGEPFDRLDLQCGECSSQRSITFDLPNFKDMYQI